VENTEERGAREGDKGNEQRVLHQVLTVFFAPKIAEELLHFGLHDYYNRSRRAKQVVSGHFGTAPTLVGR
jgi:hypothetical protein